MKRGKQGLPGGRPHRLGDLVRDGPEISSHVDRSSLGGNKVLQITISMQPDDIVTFEQVCQTWHSSISFTTCSSASASCLAKGCAAESIEDKFKKILQVKTLPARRHLFWQVLQPSTERGRNCCPCCRPPSPPQSKDLEKNAPTK